MDELLELEEEPLLGALVVLEPAADGDGDGEAIGIGEADGATWFDGVEAGMFGIEVFSFAFSSSSSSSFDCAATTP
jgi:hypothetical protein